MKSRFFYTKAVVLFLLVAACVGGIGCKSRLVDFTVISTKTLGAKIGGEAKGTERVRGKDICHWIIFIPTGFPNLKEAIDRAIENVGKSPTKGKGGGTKYDALIDGVVYSVNWHAILYGQTGFIVEGTPVNTEAMKHSMGGMDLDEWCKKNNRTIIYHSKSSYAMNNDYNTDIKLVADATPTKAPNVIPSK